MGRHRRLGRTGSSRRQAEAVGTRSIEADEMVSDMLKARGVHGSPARRSPQGRGADRRGGRPAWSDRLAPNMAGRGTDIKLGRGVAEQGEDCMWSRPSGTNRAGSIGSSLAAVAVGAIPAVREPSSVSTMSADALPAAGVALTLGACRAQRPAVQQVGSPEASGSANRPAAGLSPTAAVMEMDTWIEDALSFSQR